MRQLSGCWQRPCGYEEGLSGMTTASRDPMSAWQTGQGVVSCPILVIQGVDP
jgi:hypothetical protein